MSKDAELRFTFEGRQYVLRYRDSDHSYRVSEEGGPWSRYVACTTFAKVSYSDPGGLMHYAWKHGMNGVDYKEETKFTQECGSAAHAQLEALATTGQPLDLKGQPERVRGALQAVAKWYFAVKPEFVASEVMVCSPSLRYAGRFDFLARVNGALVLCDLKTSDKEWGHFFRYKAAAAYAQLAGYSRALSECQPDAEQPAERYVLHANTSGEYDWMPDLAPEESMASFLSKAETYRAAQNWSKAYESLRKAVLAA